MANGKVEAQPTQEEVIAKWTAIVVVVFGIWALLVLLTMFQFAHEVNLKAGIHLHEQKLMILKHAAKREAEGFADEAVYWRRQADTLPDKMFEKFDRSQKLYPIEMETLYILARYCLDEGLLDKGIKASVRDLYLNPNYKWGHNNLGVCYDRLAQIKAARRSYYRALVVDAYQVYAHFNLGVGHTKDDRFDLAIPKFHSAIESQPGKHEALKYLGFCYQEFGELEKAIYYFDRCIPAYIKAARDPEKNIDPAQMKRDVDVISRDIVRMARIIGDVTTEVTYLEKLLTDNPTAMELRRILIDTYQRTGDNAKIAHHIRQLTKYNPKEPLSWYNLAVLDTHYQRHQRASDSLKKAVALGGTEFLERARKDRTFLKFANSTIKNGKSPCPQFFLQSAIIMGKSLRYS